MTKVDLVSAVAETGMTKKEVAQVVDALIAGIKGALAKCEGDDGKRVYKLGRIEVGHMRKESER